MAAGIVLAASSFGILINSFLKNARQGGVVFGGVLSLTGMIGMMTVFAQNSTAAARLALLVPQGWGVRGLMQTMRGAQAGDMAPTALVLLAWAAVFFIVGVWRFNKRYT